MKKFVLSALMTLVASSAFANTTPTKTFQECRQSDGRLGWFLVTYDVYSDRRDPTGAEDLNQACTAGDYEASRQMAAQWGEAWPPLQQAAAPVVAPAPRPVVVAPAPAPVIVQRSAPIVVDRVVDAGPRFGGGGFGGGGRPQFGPGSITINKINNGIIGSNNDGNVVGSNVGIGRRPVPRPGGGLGGVAGGIRNDGIIGSRNNGNIVGSNIGIGRNPLRRPGGLTNVAGGGFRNTGIIGNRNRGNIVGSNIQINRNPVLRTASGFRSGMGASRFAGASRFGGLSSRMSGPGRSFGGMRAMSFRSGLARRG